MNRITYATTSPKPGKSGPEYAAQAEAWLEATDSRLEIAYARTGKYFPDDKDPRDIYNVTLRRGGQSYTFAFGQSVANSAPWMRMDCRVSPHRFSYEQHFADDPWKRNKDREQPSAYDILTCLEDRNPGLFEDFCGEYGYDTDNRKAEAVYKIVVEQYLSLARMYTPDELGRLGEIQ